MSKETTPRGVRNNNPGNLRKTTDPWQGLSQHQNDRSFFQFETPIYGIRALARTLIVYQDKHGLRSINQLISRWAPGTENDTSSYISAVCKRTGFAASTPLDMQQDRHLRPLVEAIIWHENGQQPYSEAQITKALVLAGVEPKAPDLAQSRTVRGGKAAMAATAGAGLLDAVQQTLDPAKTALLGVAPYVDSVKWLLLAITLIGIGVMVWARIDDHRKGLR